MGDNSNAYRLFVIKPGGKRPPGIPRRRCVDSMKMDLVEIGLGEFDWIGLAQNSYKWRGLMKAVMNFRVL
jgi:hypothetical protein